MHRTTLTRGKGGILVGLATLVVTGTAGAATYTSTATPVAIPDLSSVSTTITVPDSGSVKDLNVHLDITHGFVQDLDAMLISPAGTSIELFSQVGGILAGAQDFVGTILDDEAATLITSAPAPFTGAFVPEELLSAFDGEDMAGVWTLTIVDHSSDDVGTLEAWSLEIRLTICDLTSNAGTISLNCDDRTTSVSDESCTVADNGDGTATMSCDDGTEATVRTTDSACTVVDNENDTATITCDDGTSVTLSDGEDGTDGEDGSSCSVDDNGDGTKTISCEDGTSVIVADGQTGPMGGAGPQGPAGKDGKDGAAADSCSVKQNEDGSATITCEDGTRATVAAGENGKAGADGGGCSTTPRGTGAPPIGLLGILMAAGLALRRRWGDVN